MILKIVLTLIFLSLLIILVRRKYLNIDLSFPWFVSLIVLALASTSKTFIQGTASLLGIKYAPLVIVLMVLFILLALITVLGIYITELRRRQILIVRKLAVADLQQQKAALKQRQS